MSALDAPQPPQGGHTPSLEAVSDRELLLAATAVLRQLEADVAELRAELGELPETIEKVNQLADWIQGLKLPAWLRGAK